MNFSNNHGILILAGGGHTHVMMLKEWIKNPKNKPNDIIILVNKNSTMLYSGMVPGLMAGLYEIDDLQINIRQLCDQAKISFVKGEIIGIDTQKQQLVIAGRPPLPFTRLSINVGSVTKPNSSKDQLQTNIKPLEKALEWLISQDSYTLQGSLQPLTVIGSGLAAIETSFALRKRWPNRVIQLQQKKVERSFSLFCNQKLNRVLTEGSIINGPRLHRQKAGRRRGSLIRPLSIMKAYSDQSQLVFWITPISLRLVTAP